MYQPELGRWHAVDPMADKYYGISPYAYAANIPTIIVDPNGMELDFSELKGKEHRKERREIKKAFRQIKNSGETGKAMVKFLKSKDSGRIQITANEGGFVGSFDANMNLGEIGYGGVPGFGENEIGGILNVDVQGISDLGLETKDVLVEEAAHAAINSSEAISNGGNGDGSEVARGNDEFTAKSIVGQIEKESGSSITNFSNDGVARTYGKNAFSTGSTKGFHSNLKKWQSQQSGRYKSLPTNKKIPTLLNKLIKN